MIFNILFLFISSNFADLPDCPWGMNISQDVCDKIDGCAFYYMENYTMCLIDCPPLGIDDCNNPNNTNCFWGEEEQRCLFLWNCRDTPKEKCVQHPRPDWSCVWDPVYPDSDSSTYCRNLMCYDYDTDPDTCNTDPNPNRVGCVFENNWCRQHQCSDYGEKDCAEAMEGVMCVFRNGSCIQQPCEELSRGQCLSYGFCVWLDNKCSKDTCGNANNQDGCESLYMEDYIATCAWSEAGGCYPAAGMGCRPFTTREGCLTGGGACVWTSEGHCVDM